MKYEYKHLSPQQMNTATETLFLVEGSEPKEFVPRDQILNELGADGWELVHCAKLHTEPLYVFKRVVC